MGEIQARRPRPVVHFGPVRKCRVHRLADGCECSWTDCLPELQPYEPPTAEFVDAYNASSSGEGN